MTSHYFVHMPNREHTCSLLVVATASELSVLQHYLDAVICDFQQEPPLIFRELADEVNASVSTMQQLQDLDGYMAGMTNENEFENVGDGDA